MNSGASPRLSSDPLLSVIVVAADSGDSLGTCVAQVLACPLPLELILSDNASTDGAVQAVRRTFVHDARLHVIHHQTNLGFGKAVNRAAVRARGNLLLVLNPDCLPDSASLIRLVTVAQDRPEAGLVGAVMYGADGRVDRASHRRDPLLRRALLEILKIRGEGVNVSGDIPPRVMTVDAVSGALMLLKRVVFEHLAGFDEDYFLHGEDLDLCRRVRDAGWLVLLAGDVRVLHGKGGSSQHRPIFVNRHKHAGMWRWFRKFDPAARNPFLTGLIWLGIWMHFVLQTGIHLLPGSIKKRHGGQQGAL